MKKMFALIYLLISSSFVVAADSLPEMGSPTTGIPSAVEASPKQSNFELKGKDLKKFENLFGFICQRDKDQSVGKDDEIWAAAKKRLALVITPRTSLQLKNDSCLQCSEDSTGGLKSIQFRIPYRLEGKLNEGELRNYTLKSHRNFFMEKNPEESGTAYSDILEGYEDWSSSEIKAFANNVLSIIFRENDLHDLDNEGNAINAALKVCNLIFVSERIRSEKALTLTYIEFHKLNNLEEPKPGDIERMFFGIDSEEQSQEPALVFSQPGGQRCIQDIEFSRVRVAFEQAIEDEEQVDDMLLELWRVHEIYDRVPPTIKLWKSGFREPLFAYVEFLTDNAPQEIAKSLIPILKGPQTIANIAATPFSKRYLKAVFLLLDIFKKDLVSIFSTNFSELMKQAVDCDESANFASMLLAIGNQLGISEETLKKGLSDAFARITRFGNKPEAAKWTIRIVVNGGFLPSPESILKDVKKCHESHFNDYLIRTLISEYVDFKDSRVSQRQVYNAISKLHELFEPIRGGFTSGIQIVDATSNAMKTLESKGSSGENRLYRCYERILKKVMDRGKDFTGNINSLLQTAIDCGDLEVREYIKVICPEVKDDQFDSDHKDELKTLLRRVLNF